MNLVGAALGDGSDDAAGGAAVLRRVDAGVDGELANGAARSGVSFAGAAALRGKVSLVVIGAVDLNIVEVPC